MQFIEMTGRTLGKIITVKELHTTTLEEAGVHDSTIVRVNEQGDIEVRRKDRWDVIGGLLGNYEERIRHITGLDWAS
ncbi:MAG: hypothetical protein AB7F89_04120 [Pirellulaceae bacterium]